MQIVPSYEPNGLSDGGLGEAQTLEPSRGLLHPGASAVQKPTFPAHYDLRILDIANFMGLNYRQEGCSP